MNTIEVTTSAFILGTIGFWITTGILTICIGLLIENSHKTYYGLCFFALVIYGFALNYGGIPLLPIVKALSWSDYIRIILWYILIGVIWLTLKWYVYTYKWRLKYIKYKEEYAKKGKDFKESWDQYRERRYDLRTVPMFKDHREKSIDWCMLWPFSVVGTILSDWLEGFFKWIGDFLTGVFNQISKHNARGLDEFKDE